MGALVTILAIAYDPFTQNLIHYYQDNVPDSASLAYLSSGSVYTMHGAFKGGDGKNKIQLGRRIFLGILTVWQTFTWTQS